MYSQVVVVDLNQFYKSGAIFKEFQIREDSLFVINQYYENGILKERNLIERGFNFNEDDVIAIHRYFSNGQIEQEIHRLDSLDYKIYTKKRYNGNGNLRESYQRISRNYQKTQGADTDWTYFKALNYTQKYYSNGQIELYLLKKDDFTRPVIEKQYYRNGCLKYFDNGETQEVLHFYPNGSLQKISSGAIHSPTFVQECYEDGGVMNEMYFEKGQQIQKSYFPNGQISYLNTGTFIGKYSENGSIKE